MSLNKKRLYQLLRHMHVLCGLKVMCMFRLKKEVCVCFLLEACLILFTEEIRFTGLTCLLFSPREIFLSGPLAVEYQAAGIGPPAIPLPRHLRSVVEPFVERRTLAFACW